jgi:hypothetical protein
MTLETTSTTFPIRIIELIGLPGTGKSTIARCLESILGTAGVTTRSRSIVLADDDPFVRRQQKRLQLIIRNSRNCGHLYRRSLRLIADSGQKSTLDFAVVALNFWSIVALMAERCIADDRVMIADHGLVQGLWSVQLSSMKGLSLDAWAPLLLSAGLADTLLVHVQTDISISRHRVSERTRSTTRLDSGSSDEQSRRWQVASANMSDLVAWAQKTIPHDQCGGRVLTVMNHEGAPEAAAAEIAFAYFKRDAVRAGASGVQESQERAHEDHVPDHQNGQHRRSTNPRTGPLTMVETKRT